jgi:hypothetical protein
MSPRVRRLAQRVLLVCASFLICLTASELVLGTGWFDGESDPQPIWIPPHLHERDRAVDAENEARAAANPFGFNDQVRSPGKPPKARIVILGDSFIWGDGLPYDAIWSRRLERRITAAYGTEIEVLSWGKKGWATVDEYSFLKEHAHEFAIDLLIVGWVSNDPDVYMTTLKPLVWQDAAALEPVRRVFPLTLSFLAAHINNVLQAHLLKDRGYVNWEQGLYGAAGLREYSRLLRAFSRFCKEREIDLLFVMTPNNLDPVYQKYFAAIKPLLDDASIPHLDLYPAVKTKLADVPPRRLWANPADGHPGELMTEVFAEETHAYLASRGILDELAARK